MPPMIIQGRNNRISILRRQLVWAANLVAGVKSSFDDGSFAAYLFYVNDITSNRKAGLHDCLRKTSSVPGPMVSAGDIVVLENCSTGTDIGVITSVCHKGIFVTTYCTGRVENRFIQVHTLSTRSCSGEIRPLKAQVKGYRRITG